jgi:hypothetical protein
MKMILVVLGMLFGSVAFAATEQYSGINLEQGNALQLNLCNLKSGKTMANYDRVVNGYVEWSKENDVEVFVLRLTPVFVSANPNGVADFDFIDMQIGPFDVTGSGWNKWLTSAAGQKLNAQWQEVADCRVQMNAAFIVALDQEALSATDDRVMTFNWCTRNEGVSSDQLTAKHRQFASSWTTDSPIKAWTVMYPSLGSRNTPGGFAHLLSFEDANGLMAWQNATANNDGWRVQQDYETSYANCIGNNVYHAKVINRPGS